MWPWGPPGHIERACGPQGHNRDGPVAPRAISEMAPWPEMVTVVPPRVELEPLSQRER